MNIMQCVPNVCFTICNTLLSRGCNADGGHEFLTVVLLSSYMVIVFFVNHNERFLMSEFSFILLRSEIGIWILFATFDPFQK